jgi:surface antigen
MSGTDLLAQTQLPPGARILHDQSMVIGSGNNWVGRVVIDSAREPAAAFSYFLDNYPTQGWTLLSAVRAKTSVMVFSKQEHNVTIEIQESNMLNGGAAIVILTRAPRNVNEVNPASFKQEPSQAPDIQSKP